MKMTETKKKGFFSSLIFKLLVSIVVGILVGLVITEPIVKIIVPINEILSQLINYILPFIILGFITPAIIGLKDNAGKVLTVTLLICYLSSVGAAFMSFIAGNFIITRLIIATNMDAGK